MTAAPGPWREHFARLSRQRLPFLPLVLAGAAGIVAGRFAGPWLMAGAAAALLAAAFAAPAVWRLAAASFCVFAALAGWNGAAARALAAARPGPEVAVVWGRVLTDPRPSGDGRWTFDARLGHAGFADWGGPLDLPVAVGWAGPPPSPGDAIRIAGSWERLPGARNPGAFDSARWHALRGIYCRVRAGHPSDCQITAAASGFSPRRIAARAREWLVAALTRGLDPGSPQAHLLVAMTLGDTRPLEDSLLEDFRETGTFHLFSVSGLHVGMLGLLLWILLRAVRVPARAAGSLIIPALFFYALLTGWKPASVRAATMAAFVLAGLMLGRPPVVLNSLLAAAFFILLADTGQLFNPGFQLSFSVVFALVLLAPPIEKVLRKRLAPDEFIPVRLYGPWERVRSAAAGALAPLASVAVAAWIGSIPLTLGYFHLVSLVAVPANMVCVPVAFAIMAVAMMAVCSGWLLPGLGVLFNNANWALASLLLGWVPALASLPGASVFSGAPAAGPRLTVLDMGGGGAQLFEAGGRRWLFDTGPRREFERTLRPFLRARGLGRLEGLVLSHGDAAHLGAADEVERVFRPRVLAAGPGGERSPVRRALFAAWEARGVRAEILAAGDVLELGGGWRARVLFPPRDFRGRIADDAAMVVALEGGGWRVLLFSDAGPAAEHWLLENAPGQLRSDVLVKGAHRSGVSPEGEFLEAVSPRLVVATERDFPSSEKIPPEFRARLAAHSIPLLSLREQGAVIFSFRGPVLRAEGFAGGAVVDIPRRP